MMSLVCAHFYSDDTLLGQPHITESPESIHKGVDNVTYEYISFGEWILVLLFPFFRYYKYKCHVCNIADITQKLIHDYVILCYILLMRAHLT